MKITYPIEWNETDVFERPKKGWLNDVFVTMDSGEIFRLAFRDPLRLQQDFYDELKEGKIALLERGLIVIPEVTKENIEKAIDQALKDGYFEK